MFFGVLFLASVTRVLTEWTRYRSGGLVPTLDIFGMVLLGVTLALLGLFPDKMFRSSKT